MKRLAPALLLFFLSPAIAELLSGSAPPVEFFSLPAFFLITCLYGPGALLVRELSIRWHKGWPTVLALGAAYGIVEEGLMVKSFFNPQWMDLGVLGSYGRWVGVNWVWSLELTIFHAVVSIAIPITLVGIIMPGRRDQPFLGRGAFIGVTALLAADVVFVAAFLVRYWPSAIGYVLAVLAVVGLVWLARRLPANPLQPAAARPARGVWFWVVGFVATVLFFIVFWGLPNSPVPAPVTMLVGAVLVGLAGWLVLRMSGNLAAWADRHRVALIGGVLSAFALLSPIREFGQHTDNPAGMTVVGLLTVALVALLWWRVNRRGAALTQPAT